MASFRFPPRLPPTWPVWPVIVRCCADVDSTPEYLPCSIEICETMRRSWGVADDAVGLASISRSGHRVADGRAALWDCSLTQPFPTQLARPELVVCRGAGMLPCKLPVCAASRALTYPAGGPEETYLRGISHAQAFGLLGQSIAPLVLQRLLAAAMPHAALPPRPTLGSMCSGMDAAATALRELGVPFAYVFVSEVNRAARRFLEHVRAPRHAFGDCRSDAVRLAATYVDIFVAGWPCQPFCQINTLQTDEAKEDCMSTFMSIVSYIARARPRLVILENTDALLYGAHLESYTERIFNALAALPRYRLYAGTLDLKHAGGPAASRNRLFIVLFAASP